MSKQDHLTPRQKRIVRNYYANLDTLMFNKLSELLSDLYVCEDPKKAASLWQRVESALRNMNVRERTVRAIVDRRDLRALARLLTDRC